MEETNIGKDVLDVYPDAIHDTTKKGALKSFIIPSEQMMVDTTKDDKIVRIYDPLSNDEEEPNEDDGFIDTIFTLP